MEERRIKLIDQVNIVKGKKQQVYTFSVLTFVVVLILVVGAIKPSIETMARLNSEIKQKEIVRDKLEDKMNALNELSLQYAEFEETAEDLELIFPTNGDFSLFLANIESLSEESGFDLKSISFGKTRRQGSSLTTLKSVRIDLQVEGAKEEIIPFLQKLESLPMYPEIKVLSYSTDEEDGLNSYAIMMIIYEIQNETFYE